MAVAASSTASAVMPKTTAHSSEEDFAKGKLDQAVLSSYGEVRLARRREVRLGADDAPTVLSGLTRLGGDLYFARGASATIHRLQADADKAEPFAELPSTIVTYLSAEEGKLMVGTGGEKAGIYRVDRDGTVSPAWVGGEDVTYVWSVVKGPRGVLYAATGPKAGVYRISDGQGEKIYALDKLVKNILCLAWRDGTLYAGTDEKGLVVEIDPARKRGRVILDADEKEVSAIVPRPGGGLYVSTADVAKASGNGEVPPRPAKEGKAERPAEDADENAARNGPGADVPAGNAGEDASSEEDRAAKGQDAEQAGAEAEPDEGREARSEPAGKQQQTADAPAKPAQGNGQPAPPATGKVSANGNSVYFIRPSGVVEIVFRRPVTILAMALGDGRLLLGTGNNGAVYSVRTDGDEVIELTRTESSQVTAMTVDADGALLAATSNPGSIVTLSDRFAAKGTLVSEVLDAGQIARWGTLNVDAAAGEGAGVTIATRSGNLAEPDDETWSDWSREVPLAEGIAKIPSPSARYLQYRLTLSSEGATTPVVKGVELIHQVGNLAPTVSGVTVEVGGGNGQPRPQANRTVKIDAKDVNGDKLTFKVAFRKVGSPVWIEVGEDLKAPQYVWNTMGVEDGQYELRVEADDARSNPPGGKLTAARISDPVDVDNTAPLIRRFAAQPKDGGAEFTGLAEDRMSRVATIEYSLDAADEWSALLPDDRICDELRERFAFTLEDLDPGAHRVAVRVTDALGNVGYASVTVVIPMD
jgi:hypothetical protein